MSIDLYNFICILGEKQILMRICMKDCLRKKHWEILKYADMNLMMITERKHLRM